MNNRTKKFITGPRHLGDMRGFRETTQAVNSILNGRVFQGNQPALHFSDGNMAIELPSETGSTIEQYVITALTGTDYITARTWDGTTMGTTDVFIAKPPRMRPSVTQEFFDNISFTYAQYTGYAFDPTGDNNRTATDASGNESQCIFPRYITVDTLATGFGYPDDTSFLAAFPANNQAIIRAVTVTGGTGLTDPNNKPITLEEISPFRTWAKRFSTS